MATLHVALVEPEIHWNTGNTGRSCLAFGAQLHLIEPLGFSLEAHQVKRAGLDYWPRVKPELWPSFAAFEAALPSLGEAYFLSPDGERPLWSARFGARSVLILGRESVGFDPAIRARYRDRLYSIPMVDAEIRALNLSTTAALALYEHARQRAQAVESAPRL